MLNNDVFALNILHKISIVSGKFKSDAIESYSISHILSLSVSSEIEAFSFRLSSLGMLCGICVEIFGAML